MLKVCTQCGQDTEASQLIGGRCRSCDAIWREGVESRRGSGKGLWIGRIGALGGLKAAGVVAGLALVIGGFGAECGISGAVNVGNGGLALAALVLIVLLRGANTPKLVVRVLLGALCAGLIYLAIYPSWTVSIYEVIGAVLDVVLD